jgi:hypothetical protein
VERFGIGCSKPAARKHGIAPIITTEALVEADRLLQCTIELVPLTSSSRARQSVSTGLAVLFQL